jgi:hypothetical protein
MNTTVRNLRSLVTTTLTYVVYEIFLTHVAYFASVPVLLFAKL